MADPLRHTILNRKMQVVFNDGACVLFSPGIPAIFEVVLGSCRCIYACRLGLCEMEQTVLCNHGNSEMGQQCCIASFQDEMVQQDHLQHEE